MALDDDRHERLVRYRDASTERVIDAAIKLQAERDRGPADGFHGARLSKRKSTLFDALREHSRAEVALTKYTGIYSEIYE